MTIFVEKGKDWDQRYASDHMEIGADRMIQKVPETVVSRKCNLDEPKKSPKKLVAVRYVNATHNDRASSVVNEFGHGNGSFFTAYFNVVCVVAGTGTLGLPKAFADGGWLGILILILAYAMAVYSGIVLIRCLYCKPGERLHDYKAIGTAAFGWVGYIIASALHFLNLFGCPALYLVLAAGNMHALLQNTAGALDPTKWTIIWAAFLLIPSLTMKTLKEVTSIAAVGAICTMMAVFVVLIQAPMDHNSNPKPEYATTGVIWTGFPSSLATIAFSFGGNNTYPHVEHALKKPHQWKWAIVAGLSTCTCLYFLTAIPGYWSYGGATKSPIYNSLPDGAGKTLSMIVMTIHVIFAIPIYSTSFSLEFEKFIRADEERIGRFGAWLARAIIRTCTMVILAILAIFIPYFDDFMGLIGALANCGLVFLLPIICYLKLTGVRNKPFYELGFCALTIFLGIIGCVFGTKDAVQNLIRDFQGGHE
ncbi:transmembrane amino acid transporter protein-domain-containing protein [Radiomyces spectabilis]|uniref:transmembrane amino acid transporter protein-domain-containing protein n=1 Tax=Radiomyces spectabilis TaxID=64574 RepID=UPI00221EA960|nr:transmembrane amino acid transporter protein-domain-containing protein [Radiomyces spectabilis]KAI8388271.1 transmembrane amino acid transporter protein-domain-containing protein [Radiomyces spectabilis]